MKTGVSIVVLLLFIAACRPEEPPAPGPAPSPHKVPETQRTERENLLNVIYGAAVVSRTAELALDNSAIRAIDGDITSAWNSPPHDFEQTLTFSLAAPVRIDAIGVRTSASPLSRTKRLAIEGSPDGITFSQIVSPELQASDEPQLFDVDVPHARFIRVTTLEGGSQLASLHSVQVRGSWLASPVAPPIGDCWTINGLPAAFTTSDGSVAGVIDDHTHLDGGVEGAAYRLAWVKDAQWGQALITLTPDGGRLSGMTWHEEPAAHSFGRSLFGERRACRPARMKREEVVTTTLARAGWYPLFGLTFNSGGTLVPNESEGALETIERVLGRVPSQRIRLVAREYRGNTPAENRRRSELMLQSLRNALTERRADVQRIEFVALGSDSPRRIPETEPMRLLSSAIEIQLPQAARSVF